MALARARPALQRLLGAGRALSEAASSADERSTQEPPLVFAARKSGGKDGKLRYFVLKEQTANPALAVLESAANGTSLPGQHRRHRRWALPPTNVCNSVLVRASEDPGAVGRAAAVAQALLAKGVQLEAHTLKALFGGLARVDELGEALPVLDAWLQQQEDALAEDEAVAAPLQVMTLLMDTALRAENTQLLLQVLARMARIGVTPSPQSLTTLLQCFMRLGHAHTAHSVLDWMRRNGLEPSIYAYTALLALPKDVDEAAAKQLLQQAGQLAPRTPPRPRAAPRARAARARSAHGKMLEDGVEPNARYFTELIRICGRAGDLRAAEEAWADVQAAGVQPDLILFSAMIDTCAKCKDAAAAQRVFDEMRRGPVQPDVVAYTSVLTALQGAPQASLVARGLWAAMRADGVAPNGMAVAAFVDILLTEGAIDEALQTLTAAQPGQRVRSAWGRKMAGLVDAAGLGDAGGLGGSAATAGAKAEEGDVDLPRLYERFMHSMAHKGRFEVVERLARHMHSRGLRHTPGTTAALLTAHALKRRRPTAKWLLQPPPGSSSAAAALPDEVVESCLLGRGSAKACMQRLMGHRGSSGGSDGLDDAQTSQAVANAVLGGLAVQGHAADTVRLFEWMQAGGAQQQQQQQQQQQPSKADAARRGAQPEHDAWAHQLLLFAALNAPAEQQLDLTLRAVKATREFASRNRGASGKRGGHGAGGWDRRTRAAVAAVLRQSERAAHLLGGGVGAAAEEREEQLSQLRSLLT